MADYVIKDETLADIADAIRSKREKTSKIPTTSMAAEILAIETGITPSGTKSITTNGTHDVTEYASAAVDVSPKLQEKVATPALTSNDIMPDAGYDGMSKVTIRAMPAATQATPDISVSSAGLITASATQNEGYVSAGTKSATKQLTTQAAQTITPGTSDKTISSGRYLTGTQTIKGDSNLVASNIKKGVSIFGVTGTHEGGTTVQKKTGAFTLDEYGEATVNCGFKPDCVAVYGGIFAGETVYPGAMFTEAGVTVIKLIVAPPSTEYLVTVLPVTQTSNGFSISEAVKATYEDPGAYTYWTEASRTFNYVALKYT